MASQSSNESESLSAFVTGIVGESHLRVETDLGDGFVRLRSSEAERRQAAQDIRCSEDILIELLRNARDAHARNVFVSLTREGPLRRIVVIDDGDGVPESKRGHIFEPRVTSKLDTAHMDKWGMHGRGMALYSIKVNSQRAYVADSLCGEGSSFVVETDTGTLPEKTDQSTFPVFELQESGAFAMRGPKNLMRTACEFALESREACAVYVGSATDVAATLLEYGRATLSPAERAFCDDVEALSPCKRLSACASAEQFAEIAACLGIHLSSRSAHRILRREVAPLQALTERLRAESFAAPASKKRPSRKMPLRSSAKLKLRNDEVEALRKAVLGAYGEIAERYYLDADCVPDVRLQGDSLHITIPIRATE